MFELNCEGCGAVLRLKDEYLGRRVKCPKCGTSVVVAEPEPASSPYDDDPLFSINTGLQAPPVHQEFRPLTELAPVPPYLSSPTSPRQAVSNPNFPASAPPVPVYSTHDAYPNGLGQRTTYANPNGAEGGLAPPNAGTGIYGTGQSPAYASQSPAKTWSMSPGKIATGLLMMLGAAAWFVAGLAADRIFIYPPILFIIGIGTVIKGFMGQSE
jgi:hypothetical protein